MAPTSPKRRKIEMEAPHDLREQRHKFDRAAMPPPTNDLLLRAARREVKEGERPPFWAMRQAGRYLPEFRAIRVETSFFEVCRDPTLATEVTLQPLRRYPDLDAVIIFSDILVIPVAMGMDCEMVKGEGPKFNEPLTRDTLNKLTMAPNVEDTLGYVFDAIHFTKLCLDKQSATVPIIGFCGAPWSLFGYMVEGGGSRTWSKAKSWLYSREDEVLTILRAIRDICIAYLIKQYDAGASLLQVFDTNAGELPPHVYEKLIVPDLLHIAMEVKRQRPAALLSMFPKDAPLTLFNDSDYDVIGVSWKTPVATAIAQCPNKTLQGNLDPCVLLAPEDIIKPAVTTMCDEFRKAAGYICNLGHGMMPEHTPEALRAAIDAAKGR
uniref:Uroporphyrinogen decarboxylase n=1 Tax=Hematodinium sp. SG-2015 TaxID=1649283 RepID=A0A0F7EVR6_9DINO|nr:HemE [Hematodinium sp. SG-2015]|eukprot:GEMP01031377.1.p1 GENE.GEMP01031377.1~~GEMP01031377.1.p1  ORF type:complete len:379 (+),score=89.51 GEMP01031377.1:43-1179(+)